MYLKFGDQNLSHKKRYNYSKKMFKGRAKPMRKTDDPDNQSLDKWSSTVLTHTYIHNHVHIHICVYTHKRTRSSYLVCRFMLLIKVTKFWKWLLVVGNCFTCSCSHICFSLMNTALTQKRYFYLLLGQKIVEVIPFGIHQRMSMKNKD